MTTDSSRLTKTATPSNPMFNIASGKGGVGKTWFATTLAQAIASAGHEVLLFDGDLGLANVDVQLGLSPRHDLGSVIAGRVPLKEAITRYRAPSAGGEAKGGSFDVLAGKSGSGLLSALGRAELIGLRQGLLALNARYNAVVVDLAAGLDSAVLTLCENGGVTLVLVNDEPTSLTDAYAFIKLLTMRDREADVRIVVNSADDKEHGQRTYEALLNACRNFLDLEPPLAGIVPRDDLVKVAIRHQAPLLYRHPQSRAGAAVVKIAADLMKSSGLQRRSGDLRAHASPAR